jgi:uncharacterized protein YjbJ (UPF0337 family)
MRIMKRERRPPDTPAPAPDLEANHDLQANMASVGRRVSGAIETARASAATLIARVPGTMKATRAGAHDTTSALQTLPDPTLRWLAATSVGLGAGLYMARAPRLAIAAGVAPALFMGAAIVLRPIEPVVPAHEHLDESTEGVVDMTDEHTKGAISKVQGKVEAGLGRLTGNKQQQAKGKARQVKGAAQNGLGDVQDAVRKPKTKP